MNRTVKKIKLEGANYATATIRNGYSMIHSGHYMTSFLHDNENEDTVEMPIASPDASNNDVTVNTINASEQETYADQDVVVVTATSASSSAGNSASTPSKSAGKRITHQGNVNANGQVPSHQIATTNGTNSANNSGTSSKLAQKGIHR
jgi:hypothetical protein